MKSSSKFYNLYTYFFNLEKTDITLSLTDIEKILSFELTDSAYKYTDVYFRGESHSITKAWTLNGFKAFIDSKNKRIRFVKKDVDITTNTQILENRNLLQPTTEIVDEYLKKWHNLEHYPQQENILDEIYRKHNKNNDFEEVLTKVVLLDKFYSTHINDPIGISNNIISLSIDDRLEKNDISLVDDIAFYKGSERNEYSFATKFCSRHKPKVYPIVDSFVVGMLYEYNIQYGYTYKFSIKDLGKYKIFYDVYNSFIRYFELSSYTFKQIDKFLWQYGKELGIKKNTTFIKSF